MLTFNIIKASYNHAVFALSVVRVSFGLPTPKKNEADERIKRTTAAIKVYIAIFSLSW